ncbi:glycoside hydrolase [Aureobasidium sp. EXF-3400]|nr:glycoside hydrolase [Aureobasidium sp. EXF-12344]KAI4779185.1 glycoside hydrolase [Aureobasidium sp. EXF-3400]
MGSHESIYRLLLLTLLLLLSSLSYIFYQSSVPSKSSGGLYQRSNPTAELFSLDVPGPVNVSVPLDRRQTSASSGPTGEYTCGSGRPCANGACCGESGYCGFGPTYCGKGCTSNCDAKADCGQYAKSPGAECPLNVCCSQFGFCGTTSDFCNSNCQSNCGNPSSPGGGGDVRKRVIGYYESWSATKSSCGKMDPSEIPVEALTHLNYAFAYVNPGTYDIVPMSGTKASLFSEVTSLKQRNPDLKVWISIGGWSFNDNNTATQHVFSDAASSITKRALFALKLTQFMTQYGFDGADIDWEYPGAPDRGGSSADVVNYPALLDIIKFKWKVEGKNWGLSFTAPTSYWYLRWFDLPGLTKHVDFINLMSYDLHGIWDSTDPIGPYVYGHTNLTEIDLALELFWRVNVSPSMINLGLALYGRTFELKDPSCTSPGCGFAGPGAEGKCTRSAGILSYSEIQEIIENDKDKYVSKYDQTAGVNYLVYNRNSWVSYDDKTTFQQKIDFANKRGLAGLLLWAVDMDDAHFTGLKSITGKDLIPRIGESATLGHFNTDKCFITHCKDSCPDGFDSMTKLNQDANGKGCSGKDHKQRQLCCPAWGAPDPASCRFRGKASECYGQCNPGEVLLATDNYGGSSHCVHGKKAFCCPATSGASAVAACKLIEKKSCPSDLPQEISRVGIPGFWSDSVGSFCCPPKPEFNNCKWFGEGTTCANNRCPTGQIELTRSSNGNGGKFTGCVLGRQQVLCCDPPFNGTAFIPVDLENLFPNANDLPTSDAPVYAEAFDHDDGETPTPALPLLGDDPNRETFAWYIAVGAEEDVQSLRKRDGSQMEAFECPTADAGDYTAQTLKAVCLADGDDNNCEDILKGGAYGTLLRLPEDCGPDTFGRVISFNRIQDYKLPSHLQKRAPSEERVYEIRYDYNFRRLRRDGKEIYMRMDASNHPGYWDAIVASKPGKAKRNHQDWRDEHFEWFDEKTRVTKRGYSADSSWWSSAFNKLLTTDKNYGLSKSYKYNQLVYSASRSCPPAAVAALSAEVIGELNVNMDYGISLICTLRDFDCSESYAYFRLGDLNVTARGILSGNAGFVYQSRKVQLLDKWDPFGASFNLKGLWTIGPYFDATAQIMGRAVVSGKMQTGASWLAPGGMVFMFPQGLDQQPSQDILNVYPARPYIEAGTSASISADGSLTLTVSPAVGFTIELDAIGTQLINTDIRASFDNSLTLKVGASTESCQGANYQMIYGASADITVAHPLPGWIVGQQDSNIFKQSFSNPKTCYPWSKNKNDRRSIDSTNLTEQSIWVDGLMTRDDETDVVNSGALFPDVAASALRCSNTKFTPTGDCNASVDDGMDEYGIKPSSSDSVQKRHAATSTKRLPASPVGPLDKRATKDASKFCLETLMDVNNAEYNAAVVFPAFLSSSQLIKADSTVVTYGPAVDDNCNNYDMEQITTPAKGAEFATEHILEAQLLGIFLSETASQDDENYDNPIGPSASKQVTDINWWTDLEYDMCQYFWFWWNGKKITINGVRQEPIQFVAQVYPGKDNIWSDEFMLLAKDANSLKERLWGKGEVRDPGKMTAAIAGTDPKHDFNWAINNCRSVIRAIKYQQDPKVIDIMIKQATRIGQAFDQMENIIPQQVADGSYNKNPYTRLELGDQWRRWIFERYDTAIRKGEEFLDQWVPIIVSKHGAEDDDGDTNMSSDDESDGNSAVVDRASALKAAYAALSAWENPLPASWA